MGRDLIFHLIFMGFIMLPILFLMGFLIHESNDYDDYEKYKQFCEDNDLIMEKNSDADGNKCYEITGNKIIKYYIPQELQDGIFVLKEVKG